MPRYLDLETESGSSTEGVDPKATHTAELHRILGPLDDFLNGPGGRGGMCGVALENEIATALGALEGSQIMRGFARNLARQLQNAEGHISKKGYCKKSKELLQQMLTDVLDKETERKESSEEEEGDETESDVEMEELEEPGDEVEAEDQLEPDVEDRQLPLIVEVFNLLKDFGLLRYCRFQVVRYMRRLHEHLTLRRSTIQRYYLEAKKQETSGFFLWSKVLLDKGITNPLTNIFWMDSWMAF